MRCDQKPFSDVRVRQAFKFIPDRPAMIEQALSGYGWLGNDMYSPLDPGYPKDLPQRAQDLEQAKSLLKQAGYDNDLTVTLDTTDDIPGPTVATAQVFSQQALGAGVSVKVNKLGPGVFYGDKYGAWTFCHEYWATVGYLNEAGLGASLDAAYNTGHWKDPEWNALVAEAIQTVDDTKRNELVAAAAKIQYERGWDIICEFNILADGYSVKLAGLRPDRWGEGAIKHRYNEVYFK
jgi:peptide/nickel transport system substrate-binding protein